MAAWEGWGLFTLRGAYEVEINVTHLRADGRA